MNSEKLTFEPVQSTGPDAHIYRLRGPLVSGTLLEFKEVLRSESVSTILDLAEVPYMDSAGLGMLTNSYVSHQKHGRKLLLVGVNERISTLFKLTRLDHLFELLPSVESAIQVLGMQSPRNVA
jgi:anti-sigma B factor antagonist